MDHAAGSPRIGLARPRERSGNLRLAGVDHFAWNTVPSPQLVSQPFSTTITAQDAFNTTVTNFTGAVGISAQNGSSGPSQLLNFDTLSGTGVPVPAGYGGLTWSNFSYLIGDEHAQ